MADLAGHVADFTGISIYFRHGAKSEPGVSDDIRQVIDRRLKKIRKEWLSGVSKVVRAPEGSSVAVLPQEVTHSASPTAKPIRIVNDPSAPAFRIVDPNATYPYRQVDVITSLRKMVPVAAINSYDIQVVRKIYRVDEQERFFYRPRFSSPQYSEDFVQWLLQSYSQDPDFFAKARLRYQVLND